MPIIAQVGRKSLRVRALIALIYLVLVVGSATTVYPFMMMVGSSVTSLADFREHQVVPRFIYDDRALAAKYLDDKYRTEHFNQFKLRYHVEEPVEEVVEGQVVSRRYGQFAQMENLLPVGAIEDPRALRRVADYMEFTAALPSKYRDTYFHYRVIPIGEVQVLFQGFLQAKYGRLEALNARYGDVVKFFADIDAPYEAYDLHTWYPADDERTRDWEEFHSGLPANLLNVMMMRPVYQAYLQKQYAGVEDLNTAWSTEFRYFWEAPFPRRRPVGAEGEDWEQFVRKKMPLRYVRIDTAGASAAYLEFLGGKFGTAEEYNGRVGDNAASLEDARLAEHLPESSLAMRNWQEFYERNCPLAAIVLETADARYSDFLDARYGTAEAVNDAYGTNYASLEAVEPPYREADMHDLAARRASIRRWFITRNYSYVIKRVFLQGRAILNTFILVVMIVGTAITVNPLAAYALSRYRLSYSANVLIFMLATMAFPAEVAMIPNFLLIKELGLLNTYAALVLPVLANGYSIFLLKGFFDSLPQELYEAATIDGAGEFKMFWVVTMPLSMPILSVIALFAFTSAYSSFIWAFTVCQDSRMWTLMVFLQQFQANIATHPYLIMASLVVAAIPTVIVFLSAQKVLMKGIVVPTMK